LKKIIKGGIAKINNTRAWADTFNENLTVNSQLRPAHGKKSRTQAGVCYSPALPDKAAH
jgi:hypothetical protein